MGSGSGGTWRNERRKISLHQWTGGSSVWWAFSCRLPQRGGSVRRTVTGVAEEKEYLLKRKLVRQIVRYRSAAPFSAPSSEHLGDIRMIHHRQRLPLGLEADDNLLGVLAQLDNLQRHFAPHRLLLLRQPDGAEAPVTKAKAKAWASKNWLLCFYVTGSVTQRLRSSWGRLALPKASSRVIRPACTS
jgi:hypothetical protein